MVPPVRSKRELSPPIGSELVDGEHGLVHGRRDVTRPDRDIEAVDATLFDHQRQQRERSGASPRGWLLLLCLILGKSQRELRVIDLQRMDDGRPAAEQRED